MEPLNAAVLMIVPEQRPNSVDPLARRYACDSSPGEGAVWRELWALLGQDVLLRQPRLVATGEFLKTASGVGLTTYQF